MTIESPTVSVIIPSHNRRALLHQIFDSLARQTFPAKQFEVIVVLDGYNDESLTMLQAYAAPFPFRFIEQDSQGPSSARNHGANLANGKLLIFLDDDIDPSPDFIQSHVTAHQGTKSLIVIGYSPPKPAEQKTFFCLELQGWWETMFQIMMQPGYRFRFTDMLSGNFSISKEIFSRVGGFNLDFLVHEDYEFGVRSILAGVAFSFEKEALGLHYEKSNLRRALNRKYLEGIADIRLGNLYPELIPDLLIWRLLKHSLLISQIMRFFRFKIPKLGDWFAESLLLILPLFNRAHLLRVWRRILYGLMGYWYWKGVSQELTTLKSVKEFVSKPSLETPNPNKLELDLDLSKGLELAEKTLDETRPQALRIYFEDRLIGKIPADNAAEHLQAKHLRPYLINHLGFLLQNKHNEFDLYLPDSFREIIALIQDDLYDGNPVR